MATLPGLWVVATRPNLCLRLCVSFSYKGIGYIRGPPNDLILIYLHLQRPYFPTRPLCHTHRCWELGPQCVVGDTVQRISNSHLVRSQGLHRKPILKTSPSGTSQEVQWFSDMASTVGSTDQIPAGELRSTDHGVQPK